MPWLILSLTSRYLLVTNMREGGFWKQNMKAGSKLKMGYTQSLSRLCPAIVFSGIISGNAQVN